MEVDYECSYFLWPWQVSSLLLPPRFLQNPSHGHFCSQLFPQILEKGVKMFPFFAGLVLLSTEVLERRGKSTSWARSSWPNSWHAAVSGTGDPTVHRFCVVTTLKGETHVKCWSKYLLQVNYCIWYRNLQKKSLFFRHNESSIQTYTIDHCRTPELHLLGFTAATGRCSLSCQCDQRGQRSWVRFELG